MLEKRFYFKYSTSSWHFVQHGGVTSDLDSGVANVQTDRGTLT